MKKLMLSWMTMILLITAANAQVNIGELESGKVYIFQTHDGSEFVGEYLSSNEKDVLLKSDLLGEFAVPKYQIKSIKLASPGEVDVQGALLKENIFATRYFITTNGLNVHRGDSYILFNWYGPDIQYGVAENFTLGLMTSWIGLPIIGTAKYSFQFSDNLSLGIGALVGTLGWADLETGGALPYAAFTYGDRRNNITFSAGYGAIWSPNFENGTEGEALASVAGMTRINNSVSLVFDSFIIPGFSEDTPFTALLIPGLRFQKKEGIAFQLGLAGVFTDFGNDEGYEFGNFALPMIQFFWKF